MLPPPAGAVCAMAGAPPPSSPAGPVPTESYLNIPSEELVARKWDRCVSNLLVNTAVGSAVGVVLSFVFAKRTCSTMANDDVLPSRIGFNAARERGLWTRAPGRTWPISLSTGIGIGYAAAECQFDFAHPELFHGRRIRATAATTTLRPTADDKAAAA